jgi:PIN domain nuclease of toxin-antitoxin system
MNRLLDTCAFLWLALEPKRIPARAARAINAAPRRLISFATVWEITLKHSAGKLPLPATPRDWIPSRLDFFEITILPLETEVLFLSGELPPQPLISKPAQWLSRPLPERQTPGFLANT